MFLVVAAPVLSRALAHPPVVAVQAVDEGPTQGHAMHHDMGHDMHHAAVAASDAAAPAKASDPHADHDMGVECEYCLIAARMISLLVAVLLLLAHWPAVFRSLTGLVDSRCSPAPGTLGARGPPALAC